MTRTLSPLLSLFALLAGLASAASLADAAPAQVAFGQAGPAKATRPNIVVIMSDDMGYSDLGCYGGEIRTPNLDRLAKDGLRFTQFYNTARCCPTRASLLSGLYPHQAGVGHMMNDRGHDGYRGDLNRRCVTIAEALRPAGYSTYATGKWHLTPRINPPREAGKNNWPLQRGFDRYYGTIAGGGSFYDPVALVRDNTLISPYADPEYQPEQYYYTHAISDHASRFIREHRTRAKENQPFFLYVAYTAAHWPMQALERDVKRYRGKYGAGYEPARKARWERMRKLGLADERWKMAPAAGDWSAVKDPAWETRGMELYAAMVDAMDQGIGQIVGELKKQGELDNTLVLYLQDNGGCAEVMGRQAAGEYTRRPDKPVFPAMAPDALQTAMIPKQTRDGYPIVQGPGIMPGGPDTFHAYGLGWANVSNTPFREYKHWVHEGGISTPLIAHWPAGIPSARRNKLVPDPGHLIDVMATCIDISGAAYPTEHQGQKIQPLEGISLRPAFTGERLRRAQPLFWEHEGNRAVREGRWKLVAKENAPWELYDIEADRTEANDLSAQQPERVKELAAKWDAWAARANVLPLGTWRAPAAR